MTIVSNFSNGVIDGTQTTYINDRVLKKTNYQQGIKDSVEYFYDSLEQVVSEIYYEFNKDIDWKSKLDLENHYLVSSLDKDTLKLESLQTSSFLRSIMFHKKEGSRVGGYSSHTEVIHDSFLLGLNDNYDSVHGCFFIIDEISCTLCDYINRKDIWVVYIPFLWFDDSDIKFYELRES